MQTGRNIYLPIAMMMVKTTRGINRIGGHHCNSWNRTIIPSFICSVPAQSGGVP
jgi:hypothetical protein